jgi:hypothetical protein
MDYSLSAAILSKLLTVGATSSESSAAGFLFFFTCCIFVSVLLITLPMLIGLYKMFEKAGQPGWHAFIPILSGAVIAHIVDRPWWWGVIPYLNFVPLFELGKYFGKDATYSVGILFLSPIFFPILGFGQAQYVGERKAPLF